MTSALLTATITSDERHNKNRRSDMAPIRIHLTNTQLEVIFYTLLTLVALAIIIKAGFGPFWLALLAALGVRFIAGLIIEALGPIVANWLEDRGIEGPF